MTITLILVALYLFLLTCWGYYIAVMNLMRVRHQLTPVQKFFAWQVAAPGLLLNWLLTTVVATVIFIDLPRLREAGLTARLHRYVDDPFEEPWRRALAHWICTNLLDRFDPTGDHC